MLIHCITKSYCHGTCGEEKKNIDNATIILINTNKFKCDSFIKNIGDTYHFGVINRLYYFFYEQTIF